MKNILAGSLRPIVATRSISASTRRLVLATDGACLGNPGPGGWAFVAHLEADDAVLNCDASVGRVDGDTTNNRMELQAVIAALGLVADAGLPATIKTDSKYVQQGMTEWLPIWKARGWRTSSRKPVKNQDLWQALDRIAQGCDVTFKWVRGHSGHVLNEAADRLAYDAACGSINADSDLAELYPEMLFVPHENM